MKVLRFLVGLQLVWLPSCGGDGAVHDLLLLGLLLLPAPAYTLPYPVLLCVALLFCFPFAVVVALLVPRCAFLLLLRFVMRLLFLLL